MSRFAQRGPVISYSIRAECAGRYLVGVERCHCLLALDAAGGSVENNGNNHAVQTQHLGENENQHHADEEAGLLCGTADTRVTDNADGEASSQTSETDRETRAEIKEAPVDWEGAGMRMLVTSFPTSSRL